MPRKTVMRPPSGAATGSPSPTATPRAPLFLARRPVPFVMVRFVHERLLFVCDETKVALGLNRFYDLADECSAVFLGRLLKKLLNVCPNDHHPRCAPTRRQLGRFDRRLRKEFQDLSLSLRPDGDE